MKFPFKIPLLLTLLTLGGGLQAKAATLMFDVQGGGGEPLTLTFHEDFTFQPTQGNGTGSSVLLVLEDLWDNSLTGNAALVPTTVNLDGGPASLLITVGGFFAEPEDLLVRFASVPGFSAGESVTLSAGSVMSLGAFPTDYTSINSSGQARLTHGETGVVLLNSVGWQFTPVPEPEHYLLALSCLGIIVIARRRFLDPQQARLVFRN